MQRKRTLMAVAAGLILLAFPAVAQNEENSPDAVVEYDGQYFMPFSEGVTEVLFSAAPELARVSPSQVSQLKKRLEECITFFREDELLSSPRGMKITYRASVAPLPGIHPRNKGIAAELETGIYATLARDSVPAWEPSPDARITIYLNNPAKLAGPPVINDIYVEPRITGDFFGHPEMDRITVPYRVVAVKKHDLPLFTPVTREDFILTLISFFQNSIEKVEKKGVQPGPPSSENKTTPAGDPGRQKFINELEKIRKMDPELADKLMQAYLEAGISAAGNQQGDHTGQNDGHVDQNIMLNSWREAVRKLKAEMNAMSPHERKSQAWWSSIEENNVSGLTPAGFSGSRPLVRISRNIIDTTQPASSIQLLVVEWSMAPGSEFSETSGYNLAFGRLSQLSRNEALWNRIFKMMVP